MTTQEYIEDLISQITDAVAPNSITPAMVGTVLGYLLGRASDNSAALQLFVGNLSGYIQRGEAGVVSGSMLEDGSITRQKLSSALVEYLSGLGNVTFGYKMPATVGQTAYLSDDGLSGGQVLLFFQDSYAADEDGDVFEDLDGSDLMESLLDALEQWDRWEEMQEKYSIFDYGIVYDEDSAYIGCLYFRSSNPYFAVDADCPNSMEVETGEEFSANSSHMQPIDKRRNAGCLYVDMYENTVYRYSTEHTPFGEYVAVGGSDVTVDQTLGNSDNPVANRAINAAIAALSSSLSGKESTGNRVASITSLSDNSHYPSAKAVYDLYHALEVVMSRVDGRVTQNENAISEVGNGVSQNQNAINGLDNDLSSLANRVTSAENSLAGIGIEGDEVVIGGHSVNVRDIVLGYYIKNVENEMTLSFSTLTGTNRLSFNIGVTHYDLIDGPAIDMVDQISAILIGLGYTPTATQSGSTSWKIEFQSDSSIGVVQKTGGDQGTTISNNAVGASEGFYADSGCNTRVSGSVGKLYLDVSTNMLYRYVSGNSYEPLNFFHPQNTPPSATQGSDIGKAYYNKTSNRLYVWDGTAFVAQADSRDIASLTSRIDQNVTAINGLDEQFAVQTRLQDVKKVFATASTMVGTGLSSGDQVKVLYDENYDNQTTIYTYDGSTFEYVGSVGEYATRSEIGKLAGIDWSLNSADLDISDDNGNVLARFIAGHIKTKKFDSAHIIPSNDSVGTNAIQHSSVTEDKLSSSVREKLNAEDPIDVDGISGMSDLDITDENGKVLARFSEGHIKTKNFDSAHMPQPVSVDSISGMSDLDITDENGKVLARFSEGHIKTKNFDSAKDLSGGIYINKTFNPALNYNVDHLNVLIIGSELGMYSLDYLKDMMIAQGHITTKDDSNATFSLYNIYRNWGSFHSWKLLYEGANPSSSTYKSNYNVKFVCGKSINGVESLNVPYSNNAPFKNALANVNWDIIVIQQLGAYSDSYTWEEEDAENGDLRKFLLAIRRNNPRAHVMIMGANSRRADGKTVRQFWEDGEVALCKFMHDYGITSLIPLGTALQNMRLSQINSGDFFTASDPAHPAPGVGRYVAACCIYQAVFAPYYRDTIQGNVFTTSETTASGVVNVTRTNARVCQEAAILSLIDHTTCVDPGKLN